MMVTGLLPVVSAQSQKQPWGIPCAQFFRKSFLYNLGPFGRPPLVDSYCRCSKHGDPKLPTCPTGNLLWQVPQPWQSACAVRHGCRYPQPPSPGNIGFTIDGDTAATLRYQVMLDPNKLPIFGKKYQLCKLGLVYVDLPVFKKPDYLQLYGSYGSH